MTGGSPLILAQGAADEPLLALYWLLVAWGAAAGESVCLWTLTEKYYIYDCLM